MVKKTKFCVKQVFKLLFVSCCVHVVFESSHFFSISFVLNPRVMLRIVVYMIKSSRSIDDIKKVLQDYLLDDEVIKFINMLQEGIHRPLLYRH